MERVVTLLLFCVALLNSVAATSVRESINVLQSISDGQVIVSPGKIYALGFFSPPQSKNRYVGIWYNEIPTQTVVWVANRDNPLHDSSGVLKLDETGVLVLLRHNKSVIWSSNTTGSARHPVVAKLLDTGNLIVQNGNGNDEAKDLLWQSFDYPVDTLLPGQKFGRNIVTGLNRYLSSWNSSEDPSHGVYSYQLDITGYPQFILREGTTKTYRFGSWNGVQFSGAPLLKQSDYTRFSFISNEEELYFMFEHTNKSFLHRMVLTPEGHIQGTFWDNVRKHWSLHARIPVDDCDYYGKCGAYATCNIDKIPPCQCLDGFVPKTADLYGGCVRRTSLSCHEDGFLQVSGLKLPDTEKSWFSRNMSLEDCKILCRKNCSCKAYAALDVSKGPNGCLLWFSDLVDIRKLTDVDEDVYVRVASSELEATKGKQLHKPNIRKQESVFISCVLFIGILVLCLTFILYKRLKTWQKGKMEGNLEPDVSVINDHESKDLELPMFELSTITSATNNFSPDNKLGEGGFGSVYKGILADGGEIAVKRLSMNSKQGLPEFKNEVMHIAKLQHRNLVRLLGYCLQAGERLLVYEFMPNKSLDSFIFDENKSMLLDWPRRMLIINGVARGLLYLHQDSRHRIVHRDLKAGNVLLDSEMNPKISDFGLARSFGGNEIEATTKHVVGTYGYMSPEYIIDGAYSTKSDVFSFGVLILEIVSGKRNRGFGHQDNLLAHAWRLFTEGKCTEIVDATIRDSVNLSSAVRLIHVGLLCVQLSPDDRPNMSSVVLMLSTESTLPQPKLPGLFTDRNLVEDSSSSSTHKQYSNNDMTVSIMSAR
ncbi:S-receptor-like serine/threonine-protein kinase [Vigna unguiculata]|uniref:Receptor-like serine/threonine-protein kinase n=1 Tax=Vigna unguiculata TaxID=3917 RepID=A0A4D6N7P2_VIGUN|nr:S-receptor-like serine/threonine-protein kinase [Vigna unguiculata]